MKWQSYNADCEEVPRIEDFTCDLDGYRGYVPTKLVLEKLVSKETVMDDSAYMAIEEVVRILKEMQMETVRTKGFIVGTVTQLWVIRDFLGKKIKELGGESIQIKVL